MESTNPVKDSLLILQTDIYEQCPWLGTSWHFYFLWSLYRISSSSAPPERLYAHFLVCQYGDEPGLEVCSFYCIQTSHCIIHAPGQCTWFQEIHRASRISGIPGEPCARGQWHGDRPMTDTTLCLVTGFRSTKRCDCMIVSWRVCRRVWRWS